MSDEIRGLVQGILLAVAALLPIVNPLGNAPLFLTLTEDLPHEERRVLARKVAINGFVLLAVSMFAGDYILDFFGISVPVLQIAGGLVVATLGFRLLQDSGDPAPQAPINASNLEAKAFYPLTLPLTVGPGSISVAVTLGANFPSTPQPFIYDAISSVIGAGIVCAATYVCLAFAERLQRVLGQTGIAIVMRLSAFILLCIGVQILWNGIDASFHISKPGG
jgi:multiple antibiotic resistance protein